MHMKQALTLLSPRHFALPAPHPLYSVSSSLPSPPPNAVYMGKTGDQIHFVGSMLAADIVTEQNFVPMLLSCSMLCVCTSWLFWAGSTVNRRK